MLHREMQASVRDQSRTVRRLRRLATAATNLAGAATTQAVLDIACVEACVIQEADGAIARWWMGGRDPGLGPGRAGRSSRWPRRRSSRWSTVGPAGARTGWPIRCRAATRGSTPPWWCSSGEDFSADEELVLSSLASLIPVAFERALGTEAALATRPGCGPWSKRPLSP